MLPKVAVMVPANGSQVAESSDAGATTAVISATVAPLRVADTMLVLMAPRSMWICRSLGLRSFPFFHLGLSFLPELRRPSTPLLAVFRSLPLSEPAIVIKHVGV